MPRAEDRPPYREGTLDWHIDRVFELAEADIQQGKGNANDTAKSLYVAFLFRTCEYLGLRNQQVFDINDEIKSLFHAAWMEDAEQETKH